MLLAVMSAAVANAGPDPEIQRDIQLIRERIFQDYRGMFKPPKGALKHPCITPGSSQYEDQLWDWDSWLADVALRQILLEHGTPETRADALQSNRAAY